MAVDTNLNFQSLFESLKLEDPWLPPTTWESIPSQSHQKSLLPLPQLHRCNSSSSVSEASLVRLAMNALQGLESALISVEKFSSAFCSDPSDRTFLRIPSLWNRFSSTHALGKLLRSIGCLGFVVLLLLKFVQHFTELGSDETLNQKSYQHKLEEGKSNDDSQERGDERSRNSLVNQAFAVAVRKILEGYTCALDSLQASVGLRKSSEGFDVPFYESSAEGCLMSVVHSDITLLEMYLHTKELRYQIEVLGNICNLHDIANCFSSLPFQGLLDKATSEFCNFHRGGDLLTYLYTQLQVADPAHCAMLKFLFLRSCEPYCAFIRSWIYKAEIVDPYAEFVVEYVGNQTSNLSSARTSSLPLACARERKGVSVPCFIKELLAPLLRAGQQLQVLEKLLQLGTSVATAEWTYDDFLPCWTGFSSNHVSYESAIYFGKENIRSRVFVRDIYYERMEKKLENLLTKIEFRYQQVVPDAISAIFPKVGGNISAPLSIKSENSIFASEKDGRSSNEVIDDADFDDSRSLDKSDIAGANDLALELDDLSECTSSIDCEDQIEFDLGTELHKNMGVRKENYFSFLSFSTSVSNCNALHKPTQCEAAYPVESVLDGDFSKTDDVGCVAHSQHKTLISSDATLPFDSSNYSWDSNTTCTDYLDSHLFDFDVNKSRNFGVQIGEVPVSRKRIDYPTILSDVSCSNHLDIIPYTSSLFKLQPQKLNNSSNLFSVNPMVTKNAFLHLMRRPDERCGSGVGQSFPSFEFSAVEDPCRLCTEKVLLKPGAESSYSGCSQGPVTTSKTSRQEYGRGNIYKDSTISSNEKENISTNASGGGSWESLLCSASKKFVDNNVEEKRLCHSTAFELPLDFVIEKCLAQEIILQYNYISKLTIKLLDEGFDLQGHLRALRRYHFMELADWADSFITSLWNHKWCVIEADTKLQDIQGYLELSVQKSSCEHDSNKDRLFVYMKEQCTMSLSKATMGVDSFEFLGLGYRVEWPINIILTPAALKIYAEIFSFHVKVKLAVLSLNNIWSSLKEVSQNRHSKLSNQEIQCFNVLVKTRYQVNHFVCVLQHYVESQLSHISWCKFLQSLQLKAKDMMDLESMHMAYLTDALHICFLSEETKCVGSIINQILQCALDLRSCLSSEMWKVEEIDLSGLSGRNMSQQQQQQQQQQVEGVKKRFERSMKELQLCYVKSRSRGRGVAEFGVSPFWELLNFNSYYSNFAANQTPFHAFQ